MKRFAYGVSSLAVTTVLVSSLAIAQTPPMTPDIPPKFNPPHSDYDYLKRIEMIPMRDGVKLYHPGSMPSDPIMGGYELAISLDIFRGRYRNSFEHPEVITPDKPLLYQFGLPTVNHVFLLGHRVMVQVQSSLFPLYDRNPQTFVQNIFDAKPDEYQTAKQRIWYNKNTASFVALPVVSSE